MMDHATFDEELSDLDDLTELPPRLADHADECDRCQHRLTVMRQIQANARDDESVDAIDVTEAVLARTHRRTGARTGLLAVAAAAVVVVGGVTVVLNQAGTEPDVLADVADGYAESDGFRFVYTTESELDVVDEFQLDLTVPDEIRPTSLTLPTCEQTEPSAANGLDLQPIVDAITADDPCLALQLIDESAGPARDAYIALATSIEQRSQLIGQLEDAEPRTPLATASAAAFVDSQAGRIDADVQTLNDLEASFVQIAATVDPLSDPDSTSGVAVSSVESSLVALRAGTENAKAATETATSLDRISWTQIATGTWSPNSIDIEGSTEQGDNSIDYTTVNSDPLALAEVLLAQPDVLIDVLKSAPSDSADVVEWTIPDEILSGPDKWTAVARIDDDVLATLTLASETTSIVFTPAR